MRRSAFSLIELVLAMGLTLLVLALGVLQTRPTGSTVDTKAVARLVCGELRAARIKATTQKIPVAVVFPSQGGTYPLSQSLYNLEGLTRAKIVRYLDLFSRRCYLFVGSWPVDPAALRNPALTTSLMKPQKSLYKVEGWPRNATQDYIFMFTPDGKLLTNDLPSYDGQYHILVASRLDYAAGSRPPGTPTMTTTPPAYFDLTGVSDPVTITLTASGSVSMRPGLVAGGTVPPAVGPQALGAEPVTPASMPNTPPEVQSVTVYPRPVPGTCGTFDAVLPPDGQLTLRVRASDPEGDALTCLWTCLPQTTTQPGTFSVRGRVALPTGGRSMIWMPPPSAVTGDEFILTCSIQDDLGAEVSLSGNAAVDVMVRDTGKIVFQRPDSGGKLRLWTCMGDGTALQQLSTGLYGANVRSARYSANGSKLVFESDASGNSDVYQANKDGSARVAMLNYDVDEVDASWSNNGTQVVFSEGPPAAAPSPTPYATTPVPVLSRVNANGKGKVTLLIAGGWTNANAAFDPATQMPGSQPVWSKDGNRIAFISTQSGSPDLWLMKADGTGLTNLTADTFNDQRPRFSPDSQSLMWLSDRSGVMQVYTLSISAPTAVEQRTDTTAPKLDACFSPKYAATGGQILYVEDDGSKLHMVRAEMTATGLSSGAVDLEVSGLDRALQARPDWGK